MCLWVVRQEFVTGLSVLARGTVQEKLLWAFSLYDTDGDGVITRDDLLDVVSGIYDLMGKYAEPSITPDTAQEHVDRVFQVIIATTTNNNKNKNNNNNNNNKQLCIFRVTIDSVSKNILHPLFLTIFPRRLRIFN